jgi:hypothetical protein
MLGQFMNTILDRKVAKLVISKLPHTIPHQERVLLKEFLGGTIKKVLVPTQTGPILHHQRGEAVPLPPQQQPVPW